MSVLCCQIPDFLLKLALRQYPVFAGQPLVLLDAEGRICAVAPQAQQRGVQPAMRPQAARLLCPDLLLHPLELAAAQTAQAALLATLTEWELPVEPLGWGAAYVDLHTVAGHSAAVKPLAMEMGQRLRQTLGEPLQPALGWAPGKFTAQTAARYTLAGRLRLLDKADALRFLRPLPLTLLPLSRLQLQQLHWLGIRTLGQFADLPAPAVWQRCGAAGKTAQQWAQGRDNRPVCADAASLAPPTAILLDPPASQLQPVVDALRASLQPKLDELADCLEGVRRLQLFLGFADGAEQVGEIAFAEPAGHWARIQAGVMQRLCAQPWPAPLQVVRWALLERGELIARQLTLFAAPNERLASLSAIAHRMSTPARACCVQAHLFDASHPAPERRGGFVKLLTDLA